MVVSAMKADGGWTNSQLDALQHAVRRCHRLRLGFSRLLRENFDALTFCGLGALNFNTGLSVFPVLSIAKFAEFWQISLFTRMHVVWNYACIVRCLPTVSLVTHNSHLPYFKAAAMLQAKLKILLYPNFTTISLGYIWVDLNKSSFHRWKRHLWFYEQWHILKEPLHVPASSVMSCHQWPVQGRGGSSWDAVIF